ncbi:efflux RND transporter periplasmic adaptor subunit [Shimia ponticola]|uniref:efflux RND transporter periplasmic adaptor subunit n=1 Tax=Shimia ponticola TaxID=2582893 RepID=UPI0011BE02A7|nr:efflux RND transporter periplasmic adaptor subunit [Shimia ponticola]
MRYLFLLCLSVMLASAANLSSAQGRPSGVLVETVTTEQIAETISVFGEVVPGRESRVASRLSGVADLVGVETGDRVAEGDILAEINGELLRIQMAQAEANLAVAEASADTAAIAASNAETAYNRAENLRASSVIADAAYEERRSAFAVARGAKSEAEARVAAARIALRRAQYDLDNAVVRAPFDGVVIEVGTELGQFVSQGSEVARLIDTTDMEVEAAVPARFVDALRPESDVAALTDAGGAMTLKLRTALPTEFSSTRTRPVIFDVLSSAQDLAAGQSVTLQVPISEPRDVIAVPKDALTQGRGGWQVFIAQDGVAQPRTVELGQAIGDRLEVLSGLAPGDMVVVRGNERLRPGQSIAPRPAGGGGPPASEERASGRPATEEQSAVRQASADTADG